MAVKIPTKLHTMSPTFQKAWYKRNKMELPAHLTGSVKQASKEVKPSERAKALQAKSLKAYGATKGLKVGGEHGSGEMKDTIAPLTRDQHSKVQAAARAAKAAEKTAAPKREPIKSKEDRLNFLKKTFSKSKSEKRQARFDIPTVDPDNEGHDDLRDLHQSLHIRKGYNEEASPMIKPPTNRFDKKSDAFAHVEKHGGKVYKQTYTDSKGQQTVSYSVKKEEVELEEGRMKDIVTNRQETERLEKDLPFTPDKNPVRRGRGGPMSQAKWLAKQAMMKKMKEMQNEEVVSEAPRLPVDAGEYDYEGDMAKSQLRSILANAKRMHDMLDDKTNLPEWVQSKITLAEDYIATAANYMEGEMNEGYGGKFPKEWQKEMEKIPSTSTVVHKDKTVVTTKKDGKVVDVKTTKNEEVEQVDEGKVAKALAVGALSLASMGAKAHSDTTKSVADLARERPAVASLLNKIGAQGQVPASDKRAAELQRKQDQEMPASERRAKELKKEEVEQVSEKAPPGAKYERMVKHIKSGYAKGGLTPKEKSIAYATAWKAYKKNEEVEQVEEKYENNPLIPPRPNKAVGLKPSQLAKKPAMAAEAAEGSTPTTPKEKELAAHHGDKNKITYGDVIKARLKSVAQKAMKAGK